MSKELAKREQTAVATVADYAIMTMDAGELAQALTENLSGENLVPWDMTRVKVPSGGALSFSVPDMDNPDGVETKTITGVIVHHQTTRCYYETSFEEAPNQPPTCSSADGVNGTGNPGGVCQQCALNVFGTADGGEKRGKACKEQKVIYILTPETLLPLCIVTPPSSLKRFRNYMLGLTGKACSYSKVVTEISLTKEKNADGIGFSELFFKLSGKLDQGEAQTVKMYREGIIPALSRMAADFSEMAQGDGEE